MEKIDIDKQIDQAQREAKAKAQHMCTQETIAFFVHLIRDFGTCEAVCFCDGPLEKMIDNVRVLPWKTGLKRYFAPKSFE